MISSVEQFQGKEKKIIIVSTVRSKSDNVGFLNNFRVNSKSLFVLLERFLIHKFFFPPYQRLNVLMSRAQALLIIIGDPTTLRTDDNWNKVINIFEQNNAIISCNGQPTQKIADLANRVDTLKLNELNI